MKLKYKILSKNFFSHPEGAFIKNKKFYWIDIKKKIIASSDSSFNYKIKFIPTVIFDKNKGGLVVGTNLGIYCFNEKNISKLIISFKNTFDQKNFRTNDGCKIKKNIFLIGTMPLKNKKLNGTVYLIKNKKIYDLKLKIKIPNTFIQLNKNIFLITDSYKKKIYKIKIDFKKNKITSKLNFITFKSAIPDGGCIINKKIIAISIWNKPFVYIMDSNGKFITKILMPCKNLSNCKYMSSQDKLMITSPFLITKKSKKYPLSGKIFYVKGVNELLNNYKNT